MHKTQIQLRAYQRQPRKFTKASNPKKNWQSSEETVPNFLNNSCLKNTFVQLDESCCHAIGTWSRYFGLGCGSPLLKKKTTTRLGQFREST